MNNREQSVPHQAVEKSNLEKEIQTEQINQTFLLSKILDKTLNRKRLIDTEKSAHQDINESCDSDETADANSNQKGVLKKKRLQKEEMKRRSVEKRESIYINAKTKISWKRKSWSPIICTQNICKIIESSLIDGFFDLLKLGKKKENIIPLWIQLRFEIKDAVLNDNYAKYKENLKDLFPFSLELEAVENDEISVYIIRDNLHSDYFNNDKMNSEQQQIFNDDRIFTSLISFLTKLAIDCNGDKKSITLTNVKELLSNIKSDLRVYYEDWWTFLLSIFDWKDELTVKDLYAIYQFLSDILVRFQKENDSTISDKIRLPFIYPSQIERIELLHEFIDNEDITSVLQNAWETYNIEVKDNIKEIKLRLSKIGNLEGINFANMHNQLKSSWNKRNSFDSESYDVFVALEKRRQLTKIRREKIQYNPELDYTIREGMTIKTSIPNMKDHNIVILKEHNDEVEKDIISLASKCIKMREARMNFEGKHIDNTDKMKLSTDLYDYSRLNMDKSVKKDMDKIAKQVNHSKKKENLAYTIEFSNYWVNEFTTYKDSNIEFLKNSHVIQNF